MTSQIILAFPMMFYVVLCSCYINCLPQDPKDNTLSEISLPTINERRKSVNYLFILFDVEKELGKMFKSGIQQLDSSTEELSEAQFARREKELQQTKSIMHKLDILIVQLLHSFYATKPHGINENANFSINSHAEQKNKTYTILDIIKKPPQDKRDEISKDADLEPLLSDNETVSQFGGQMLSSHIANTLNTTQHITQLQNVHKAAVTKMHSLMRDLKQQEHYKRNRSFSKFMRRLPKPMGTSLVEKSSSRQAGVTLLRYG